AIRLSKRAPCLCAGWFFFLAAQSLESSFLPIELYYEHRNYLPSFGLLLMSAGGLALLPDKIALSFSGRPRPFLMLLSVLLVVLAFSTWGRVLVWQDARA